VAEEVSAGFPGIRGGLRAGEAAGEVRRGYCGGGLGASRCGVRGGVDELRSARAGEAAVVVAATDPANPWGAALRWPERAPDRSGHQPGRKAGALVIAVDGELVLYVERGGRTLLTWGEDPEVMGTAARGLADDGHPGALR